MDYSAGGGGGGKRVCWPPSQIIGGGGAAPPLFLRLCYKGLKGAASIPTNDLVPPIRRTYQESSLLGIPKPIGWD